MREQAISHKVGKRSGMGKYRGTSVNAQRPTRRESGGDESLLVRLRSVTGYIPAFFKLLLAVVIGVLVFAGYRAAASASFFQVRNIEIQGTSRVSADDVRAIVKKDAEKTGVWKADLQGINAHLEKLPWVRSAVVSRVLPNGIRVRITERVPRAVVRTASGRFRWIDDDAVLLGEMLPTDQIPAFFLRGLNEEDPEGAGEENRERVAKFMELQRDWDAAGLSARVSEVNLIDVRDIRAQLADDYSHIEVRLGSQDHGKRLKDALEVLDAQRQAGRASQISYIDLSQGKRAVVGMTSGAHRTNETDDANTTAQLSEQPQLANRVTSDRTVADTAKTAANRAASSRPAAGTKKDTDKAKSTDRRRP